MLCLIACQGPKDHQPPDSTVQPEPVVDGDSAVGRVKTALASIDTHKDSNAFITISSDMALNRAKELDALTQNGQSMGPLHGIPVAVKDNIHVGGLPNTAGHPALKDFVPTADAGVVARLKDAGAIVVGKTNLHEMAYGITSKNEAFGYVKNAVNPDFIAGGSSGGTAVAIAQGTVDLGLGTDTGGSSRIPAALNGIVGFRPTVDRYPSDGMTLISNTRDTVGPMARSMDGIIVLDQVMSAQDYSVGAVALTDLRLGVPKGNFYQALSPEIAERMDTLLEGLRAEGVTLIEADLPGLNEANAKVGFPVVLFETGVLLEAYLAKHTPGQTLAELAAATASGDVKGVLQSVLDKTVTEEAYQEAKNVFRPQLQTIYSDYFQEHNLDAIIFPTTPIPAIKIEEAGDTITRNGETVPTFTVYIQNTDPGSNAGIPGLSLPLDQTQAGLPFGVEIDGPENSDVRLLSIGLALESFIDSQNSQE